MPTFRFSPLQGARTSVKRAVGFLEDENDASIDAAAGFASLKENHERTLRARFDHWIDGNSYPKYYHGWPDLPRYKECFTFKWDENQVHHRLYGFLFNPKPKSAPAFRVCVLAYHDTKTDDTDFTILDRVNELRTSAGVLNAIRKVYPEERS